MLFRPPKPVSMALNLAPMVDVMMCLIIFFLLGSTLVLEESRPVELPWARAAQPVDRSELGSRVVVNVRPAVNREMPAEYVVVGWDGRNVTETVLAPEQLHAHLISEAAAARVRQEEISCVIRADRDVKYQEVETALRGCGLARIARVVFSVSGGPPPEEPPP
jgi:biopolymer transport protein ExbD